VIEGVDTALVIMETLYSIADATEPCASTCNLCSHKTKSGWLCTVDNSSARTCGCRASRYEGSPQHIPTFLTSRMNHEPRTLVIHAFCLFPFWCPAYRGATTRAWRHCEGHLCWPSFGVGISSRLKR
jgi:hypothetical protein